MVIKTKNITQKINPQIETKYLNKHIILNNIAKVSFDNCFVFLDSLFTGILTSFKSNYQRNKVFLITTQVSRIEAI